MSSNEQDIVLLELYTEQLRGGINQIIRVDMHFGHIIYFEYNNLQYELYTNSCTLRCRASVFDKPTIRKLNINRGEILDRVEEISNKMDPIDKFLHAYLPQPIAEEIAPEITYVDELITLLK